MPTYRNKTIKFNMDDEKERELWEFLEKLPYGTFTLLTKYYWELRMENSKDDKEESTLMQRIERTEQNPESAKPWESVRRDNEQ